MRGFFSSILCVLAVCVLFFSGCSHKKDLKQTTENSLHGKRVALYDIAGVEKESKSLIEVAVINELIEYGHFEIIDRPSTQEAKSLYPAESDFAKLAEHLKADYILVLRVTEFKVTERQGFDQVTEEDSVLAEENGEPGKKMMGTRYVKVKSNEGKILISGLIWSREQGAIIYQGHGFAKKTYNSRDTSAGKMELMEELSSKAVHNFFENMP